MAVKTYVAKAFVDAYFTKKAYFNTVNVHCHFIIFYFFILPIENKKNALMRFFYFI